MGASSHDDGMRDIDHSGCDGCRDDATSMMMIDNSRNLVNEDHDADDRPQRRPQ
jgi:hypothetical protein